MELDPIGIAVPVFMGLLVLEMVVAWARKRRVYRLNDSIADVSCGTAEQVIGFFTHGALLAAYGLAWSRFGLLEWHADQPLTWIVGMVGVDFLYYWYHRFSHRVNFAWATHVVHHQSEEYNLAVALRQPALTAFYSWIFYLPLAVLGIPPGVWAGCFAFNLLYQFWIHTELIGKLGWFERVFNTPSHHRVHHGINPQYIDRNHAGILIIWDRMFGTFVEEGERCLYGTLSPLRSWNPVKANLEPFADLWRRARALPRWSDRIAIWFRPPEWVPADSAPSAYPPTGRGYDADAAQFVRPYLLVQALPTSLALGVLLISRPFVATWVHVLWGALILWTLITWSGFLEGRRWALALEVARLATLTVLAVILGLFGVNPVACAAIVVFSLLSAAYLLRSYIATLSGEAASTPT